MKKLLVLTLLLVGLLAGTVAAQEPDPGQGGDVSVGLELIAQGFTHPVMLAEPPDGSDRRFIVDQTGQIWILTPDGTLLEEPFLNIEDRLVELNPEYDERGLLGLAFHPDYAENGRFFVYYSAPLREDAPDNFDHTNVLAEFRVSDDPNRADPDSGIILLEEDWPYTNHNAGTLAFGPDGMLYLSWGDGGNRDDEGIGHVEDWYEANAGGNGQDIEQNPKGSLMRMDVSTPGTVTVPEDNPFVGELASDVLELQWAYGFRNPYRFSFDMEGDHRLFVGDAGQELWEEVSIVDRGGNYGWNVKEGTHCFDAENPLEIPEDCPDTVGAGHPREGDPLIDPIIEFPNVANPHAEGLGLVVVGGYVYRGTALLELEGRYIFGVWSTGEEELDDEEIHFPGAIFAAQPSDEGLWDFERVRIANMPDNELQHLLFSFAQDLSGELYVLTADEAGPTGNTGKVFKMVPPEEAPARAVLDFDALAEGEIVNSLSLTDTITGTIDVFGHNPLQHDTNLAVAFDATCEGGCSGGDEDLRFPEQGNVLIVNEALDDTDDGIVDDPDDTDVQGASFTFDFSGLNTMSVTVESLVAMDLGDDDDEFLEVAGERVGGTIELFSGGADGELLATVPIPRMENNEKTTVPVGVSGVDFMRVTLSGSGAIDDVTIAAPGVEGPQVAVPEGYNLEAAVTGLNFPTGLAMSDDRMWVSEAGVAGTTPQVKEVDLEGNVTTVLSADALPEGALVYPLIDVTYHDGWLWITHRQKGVNDWNVGAISKFQPDDPVGTFTTVVTNLPASGDHHTDEIIFDEAGRAYFSQGTATNSSVVGPDNLFVTGWLDMFPEFHDFPPVDVVLNGREFTTPNPLTDDPDDTAVTAPFMPFDSGPIDEGTTVPGASPADPQNGIIIGNGTVYSFDPTAETPTDTLQVEAWGLRNPFGLGFDPFDPGSLFVSNNGADVRMASPADGELEPVGARPIGSDWDDMYILEPGGDVEFFGWPDYYHDPQTGEVLPVTDPLFCTAEVDVGFECPMFVLDEMYRSGLNTLPAFAQFELHSSANKFDFSTSEQFGFVGDLFVAETGAFVPVTGADQFAGYKVVRVNRATGEVSDFIVNVGNTAEELFDPQSFNKPIDVKFQDERMFVLDFGVFEPGLQLMQSGTGKVWLVTREEEGEPNVFTAELRGENEVPPVETETTGEITVEFNQELTEATFDLVVQDGHDITQAHLHCGGPDENGPVVVFLFGPVEGGVDVDGQLATGTLTDADIQAVDADCEPVIGMDIQTIADLAEAAQAGNVYANVHSVAHPGGVVRGQLEGLE